MAFVDVPRDSHFPAQNLPYGVFRTHGGAMPRVGVAIGDQVLDLSALESRGLFAGHPQIGGRHPFAQASLNTFMSMGPDVWQFTRATLTDLLREGSALHEHGSLRERAFFDRTGPKAVEMLLPAQIGDYAHFYAPEEYTGDARTAPEGPERARTPRWKHLPVSRYQRASSVVASGAPVRRPCGQVRPGDDARAVFGPAGQLDFGLGVGFFVGPGNRRGEAISIDRAPDHVFGLVLVNGWCAHDLQSGARAPFEDRFATTVSPWVVPTAALEPFRGAGPAQTPAPLGYLRSERDGAYDVHLEAALTPAGGQAKTLCRASVGRLYWTAQQQLAHHTVDGSTVRPGDLLASGPVEGDGGSLLGLTRGGVRPVSLDDGLERTFLEDGDRLTLTGWCEGDGYRVGFGECTGVVLPAEEC